MWELCLVSVGLGVGLAMDACAVSMTNGLNEPQMKFGKATLIAAMFGFFQALMPMIGWLCVSLVVEQFKQFARFVPFVALVLLVIVGGKMLFDGAKSSIKQNSHNNDEGGAEGQINASNDENTAKAASTAHKLTFGMLIVQAIATSIDALSTGFSLADVAGNNPATDWWRALLSCAIIAVVTFGISLGSVYLGKKFGDKLGNKAQIVGGVILIAIGVEIFVKGVFFS